MGIGSSKPQPGKELQVIGAGLSRTGTASFTAALTLLLDGPVYHGGSQNFCSNDEFHVKKWIEILNRTPYKSASDRAFVMDELRNITSGYVATADAPLAQFVPELMELYPQAKVICTIRDPDAWAKSIDATSRTSLQSMLGTMLFWVPCMRYLSQYLTVLQAGRYGELYAKAGEKWSYGRDVWDRHIVYLERTVPKDKLVWYDVRDGWGPLCEALGVEVPEGVEFPKVNDGNAMDEFAKRQVQKGLFRWAAVISVAAAVGGVTWSLLARSM